ncbi:hypothetical protein FH505_17830 [Bacillus velezensis]|uniref:hypothetical protein n=1 Tax=Bacillus TaxID=1386 RepID=UPI001120F0DC|nr:MULTISPECIES: hypothetical protein [Bacillus amyloliquefaciens group]NMV99598.1 hypothetical protein [Bacillus velezensis]TNU61718.1 hypothetical protein FH505_17830 [Bacillus velezensis]USP43506.1 hypothetical protein LT978_15710 [Bacillus amyloliquefaciens]
MIRVPKPAYCFNRRIPAKTHQKTTEPSEWFLAHLGSDFYTLNFDFFVYWSAKNFLSNEFWIKRVVVKQEFTGIYGYWPCTDIVLLQEALEACEGKKNLVNYGKFAASLGFKAKYQIFVDSGKWDTYPAKFITVEIDVNGKVASAIKQTLPDIKCEIQRLSGGPVKVTKTYQLKVAATNLECYLSNKDIEAAAWPGDVDLLVFDSSEKPIAILEFKKNTVEPGKEFHRSIHDESLYNYYSATGRADDNRKYNRIAILRDHLNENIPIINIYYPTWESKNSTENIIKLEKVVGNVGKLKVDKVVKLPVPYTAGDKANVVKIVLDML